MNNSKILCFNWNTDYVPLCEDYLNNKTTDLITKPRGRLSKRTECYNPLFFDEIEKEIIRFTPKVLVFLTEWDLTNGTWFHSDFIPNKLKNLTKRSSSKNYRLLTRDKHSSISHADDVSTVLRMSIYIISDDVSIKTVELNKGFLLNDNTLECESAPDRSITPFYETATILALYIQSPMGKIAFIGVQYLEKTPDQGRLCIKQLEDKFVNNKGINHVFILGDFSNQPGFYNGTSYEYIKIADQFIDEYRQGSRPSGYVDFKEEDKVANNEIDHNPTYINGEIIGYHDRILNKTTTPSTNQIKCIEYKLIKGHPINTTDHFGILGVYEVPNLK